MKKQGVGRDLLLARDEVLDRAANGEDWGRDIVAVAVGPKLVSGEIDPVDAVHFVVRRKRPPSALPRARRLPKSVGGIPTDVLRSTGEVIGSPAFLPAEAVSVGYGSPIITSAGAGEQGTLACCARSASGADAVLTSFHVAPPGSDAFLRVPGRPEIGRSVSGRAFAAGSELYGQWAANPSEQFLVDAAGLAVAPSVALKGGLPGSHPFGVRETRDFVKWVRSMWSQGLKIEAWAFGSGSGVWRRGLITSLWPAVPQRDAAALCLIQQDTPSQPADSGSLWLARHGTTMWTVGLHWGRVDAVTALVTDLISTLPLLQIPELLSSP